MCSSANYLNTSKLRHFLAPSVLGVSLLGSMSLIGCMGPDRLKEWASPHVACSADAMEVNLLQSNPRTMRYDAACDTGEVYECTTRGSSAFGGAETHCEFIGQVEFAGSDDGPSDEEPVGVASLSNPTWTRVRLGKCSASVLMPQQAVAQDVTSHGSEGQSVVVEADGHEFAFFCFDFSLVAQNVPEGRLAAGMLDGMVESTSAELVRVKPSDTSLDFVLKVDKNHHRGRVQVSNDWGYAVLIGPMEGLASDDIRKFFASVEIGVPTQAKP